ncbi:MAG: SH3 domain-containing protein [Candidatus Cloacimonetes bacterium]|nr:SH3 domain-containing protein [Candidatus Cloacimonadota bacterium]
MKSMLALLLLAVASLLCADAADTFLQANQAYDSGHYREALGRYLEIEDRGVIDADLFYNIANTYYRRHQLGRAVLYYKRALAANPAHEHALRNLSLIAGELGSQSAPPAPADADYLATRLRDFYEWLPLHTLALLMTGLLLLIVALAHLLIHAPRGRDRTVPVFALWLLVVILLGMGLLSWRRASDWSHQAFDEQVRTWTALARTAPNPSAEVRFRLHQGQPVALIATSGSWGRVMLPDGRKGWLPRHAWAGNPEAVVMAHRTDVYSGPGKQNEILFNLPEGYVVEVVREMDDWSRVQMPDGQEGWMEMADYERVQPGMSEGEE